MNKTAPPVTGLICFLHLCGLLLLPLQGQSSELEYSVARALNQAVAKILLEQQTTVQLLGDCATFYPHLASSADHTLLDWRKRNLEIIGKTNAVKSMLNKSIKEKSNPFEAEKYALTTERIIQDSVAEFKNKLKAYPTKQRHYLCNRLILSTASGERDIATKQVNACKLISDLKLP